MASFGSSRTMQRFFELSPIPLVLASPVFDDCPLILVNDPFLDLVGYSRDDVIGRNCRLLQGPKSEASAKSTLKQAVTEQHETVVSITNYRRDGSTFTNLIFLFPIRDQNGRFLYMLGSQCDVSTTRPGRTPIEHARLLDQTLELNNPLLAHRDSLRITTSAPCVRTIGHYLDGRAISVGSN